MQWIFRWKKTVKFNVKVEFTKNYEKRLFSVGQKMMKTWKKSVNKETVQWETLYTKRMNLQSKLS